MKVRFAFVLWVGPISLFSAADPGPAAKEISSPGTALVAPSTLARSALVETWGNLLAEEQDLVGVGLSETELDVFREGFTKNLRGQPAPTNLRDVHFDLETLKKTRLQKRLEPERQKNESAAAAHFVELGTRRDVERVAGGEVCEIIRPGSGEPARLEQTARVRYVGRLLDGTEFTEVGALDVVLVAHRQPFPGWIESLTRLRPGGALKLHVPPSVLRGDWTDRGVPPGAAAIFEIELLAVVPTAPRDLANALLPLAPEAPPPPSAGYTANRLVETWGWITAQTAGVAECALAPSDQATLARGMIAGMREGSLTIDSAARKEVTVFINRVRDAAARAAREKQEEANAVFFRDLVRRPGVILTPSGLGYEITRPGHGSAPEPGQIVTVKYVGRLLSGTVFDSTSDDPVDLPIDQLVPGWREGMRKINTGGAIKLYLPPSLGYGQATVSGIPPGSALIFEIELFAVRDPELTTPVRRTR